MFDLLGRRWTLRVLWELRGEAPLPFSELREACDEMSTSVLSQRLRELVDAGIAERGEAGYALSARGRELLALLQPVDAWSRRWARDLGQPGRPARRSG